MSEAPYLGDEDKTTFVKPIGGGKLLKRNQVPSGTKEGLNKEAVQSSPVITLVQLLVSVGFHHTAVGGGERVRKRHKK